jgi:hypothetical protein
MQMIWTNEVLKSWRRDTLKSYIRTIAQHRTLILHIALPMQRPVCSAPALHTPAKSLSRTESAFRDRLGSGGVCCLKDTIFHMFMLKFSYAMETRVIPCPDIYKHRSKSLADWLCMPMPCGAVTSERGGFFPTALPQSYRRHKRPAIQLLYLAHTNSRQTSDLTPAYNSWRSPTPYSPTRCLLVNNAPS